MYLIVHIRAQIYPWYVYRLHIFGDILLATHGLYEFILNPYAYRSPTNLKRKARQVNKCTRSSDRRKQWEKIEPKDATYPTVSTESVMLTATIDALEGRDVALVDIPGAYLSANIEDDVHVVFRGTLA